jgi:hypothetical protein
MRFSRLEKWVIATTGVVACLVGALAGHGALTRALEDQFHGGVLDEDKVAVMWLNARETAVAFVEFASVSWVVLGLLPIGVYRLVARARR